MPADYIELAAAAQLLRKGSDDMGRIRSVLSRNAEVARWECAKADRYRSATESRGLDMLRIQQLMADLAQSLTVSSAMSMVQSVASQSAIDNA